MVYSYQDKNFYVLMAICTFPFSKSLLFCVRFLYNNQLSLTCSLIKCFLKNAHWPRHTLIYHSSIIFKEFYQLGYARHSYYTFVLAEIKRCLVLPCRLQQNCFQYVLENVKLAGDYIFYPVSWLIWTMGCGINFLVFQELVLPSQNIDCESSVNALLIGKH